MQDAATGTRERAAASAYTARLLDRPEATAEGIRHWYAGSRALLAWSELHWAIAAEVGEPEGVRTIVFDLVTGEGAELCVHRLDAEPGDDAMQLARAIARGLGRQRKVPSIESLATDAIPTRWYPDLESFEADAREELNALDG